jgi:aryl sulfotransferase
VVARDARDVFVSLLNHYAGYTDLTMSLLNDDATIAAFPRFDRRRREAVARLVRPGVRGLPVVGNLHRTESCWPYRDLANGPLVHCADLEKDLPAEVRRIATFLGRELDAEDLALYEEAAQRVLEPACAQWLERGFRG